MTKGMFLMIYFGSDAHQLISTQTVNILRAIDEISRVDYIYI